jgi:hypothetical protein
MLSLTQGASHEHDMAHMKILRNWTLVFLMSFCRLTGLEQHNLTCLKRLAVLAQTGFA